MPWLANYTNSNNYTNLLQSSVHLLKLFLYAIELRLNTSLHGHSVARHDFSQAICNIQLQDSHKSGGAAEAYISLSASASDQFICFVILNNRLFG